MKNKKLIYILVPLAILVWGVIFYKIFTGMEDKASSSSIIYTPITASDKTDADTFSLEANYKDPFLSGKIYTPSQSSNSGSPDNRQSLVHADKSNPILPDLQYFGLISNSKSKSKVGLIKIQGGDFLLKEGEKTNTNIKIEKLFKDSVIVVYQRNKHTIKRS